MRMHQGYNFSLGQQGLDAYKYPSSDMSKAISVSTQLSSNQVTNKKEDKHGNQSQNAFNEMKVVHATDTDCFFSFLPETTEIQKTKQATRPTKTPITMAKPVAKKPNRNVWDQLHRQAEVQEMARVTKTLEHSYSRAEKLSRECTFSPDLTKSKRSLKLKISQKKLT